MDITRNICRRMLIASILSLLQIGGVNAQNVDYSVVSVPEESGTDFMKITSASDYVCLPLVKRSRNNIDWISNRVLGITRNGSAIAYLSFRNNTTNIFIKDLEKQGSSIQRTNRTNVLDFSFSPDGKDLCFSEKRGDNNQIFRTDAEKGYVCRQITSGANDYSPAYSPDKKQLFFARSEANGATIWSYDFTNNFLSSFVPGMNPCPVKGQTAFLVSRPTSMGRSEIWKINYETGEEECIVSDPVRSFTSPIVSPDGRWILFVGNSQIKWDKGQFNNTDLFVCRMDGSEMTQLTYHAADDLSPVWSADGKYIYFISQRGDADGVANIWRMTFNY